MEAIFDDVLQPEILVDNIITDTGWIGKDEDRPLQELGPGTLQEQEKRSDYAKTLEVMNISAGTEKLKSQDEIEAVINQILDATKYKEVTFEEVNRVFLLLKLYGLYPYLKDLATNTKKIDRILEKLNEIILNILLQTRLLPTKNMPEGKVLSGMSGFIKEYGVSLPNSDSNNLKSFARKTDISLESDPNNLSFTMPPFFFGRLRLFEFRTIKKYEDFLSQFGIEMKKITGFESDKIMLIKEIAAILTHSKDEVLSGFGNSLLESIAIYEKKVEEQ